MHITFYPILTRLIILVISKSHRLATRDLSSWRVTLTVSKHAYHILSHSYAVHHIGYFKITQTCNSWLVLVLQHLLLASLKTGVVYRYYRKHVRNRYIPCHVLDILRIVYTDITDIIYLYYLYYIHCILYIL
jgi:hypothetical protein